ncbi:hypothetical protein BDN72DRAFT_780832, partial [Pluteus cervinus]
SREHILRECPMYEDHRYLLRKVSPTPLLQAILRTPKGVIALTQFLKESGAFTRTGKSTLPRPLPGFIDEPLLVPEEEDNEDEGLG